MDTFKIKAALAAARHQSLSKAAEEYSYTPSAFSHMMAGLEEELGLKIFHRHSAGVELTAEGEALLPQMEAFVSGEEQLLDAAARLSGGERELRIGTYSSISRHLLSGLMKKFKKNYPHIRLSIRVADDFSAEKDVDLLLADDRAFGAREWTPMLEDRFCVVAPKELLPDREEISREELYGLPMILTDEIYLQEYFQAERFEAPIRVHSEDDLALLRMVREGVGVCVLPELVLKEMKEDVRILSLQPPLTRTLGFSYNQKRIRALGLSKFIQMLKL